MSTCLKRSVLNAGDRLAAVKRAAAAVQAATSQLQRRVQPHAGSPLSGIRRGVGAPIPHNSLGNGYDPIQDALRQLGGALGQFTRAVDDALNEAARESRETSALGEAGRFVTYIVYQPYLEPMWIPWPTQISVATVMCGRAVSTENPTERLLNGSEVDFDFDGDQLKVFSIDGMTPDPAKMITWTFLYFGI